MSKVLTSRTFTPGDPLPKIVLPDTSGKIVDFSSQLLAGRPTVFWLVGRSSDVAALSSILEPLVALDVQFYTVLPTTNARNDDPPGLCDPNNVLANAVGATRPSVVIIGADMRLVAVLEGDALEQTLSICREMQVRSQPEEVSTNVPVLMVRNVLEPELCRRLIDYWSVGDKRSDHISSGQRGQVSAAQIIKKRTDVAVTNPELLETLRTLIGRRLTVEILKAFHFLANHHETFRIGCYDATDGGYFGRHRDNTTPFTAHRRFAMSLNLNTGEYEGGQIRFPEYGRQYFCPDVGAAVIFSCSLLHEALPVTAGRRFALFGFFFGDEGAREQQKLIARERAKGRDYFER